MSTEAPVSFVPVDLDRDYDLFCSWWKDHKAVPVPKIILPKGWIACGSGLPMAVCFLYVAEGKIAVLEWMTSNPRVAFSKDLWIAVCALYQYVEEQAAAAGCQAIISFVKPNSSEERILKRMDYAGSDKDPGHKLYAKPLKNLEKFKELTQATA